MFQKEELKSAPGKFGHILKEIRQKNGYTREQFSERIGISTRYLSAIENEQREPSYDVLYRIFHGLGISADTVSIRMKAKPIILMQNKSSVYIWSAQIVTRRSLKICLIPCLIIKRKQGMSCFGNSFFYLIIYLKRAMADSYPSPPVSASDNQSLAGKIAFSCLTIQCNVVALRQDRQFTTMVFLSGTVCIAA